VRCGRAGPDQWLTPWLRPVAPSGGSDRLPAQTLSPETHKALRIVASLGDAPASTSPET
jgi:hypothetical protein